jgi:hypothetical protein
MIYDDSTVSDEPLHYAIPQHPQKPKQSGMLVLASAAKADERLAICDGCEHYRKWLKQCAICNCIMPFKVRFEQSSCPAKHW